MTEVIIQEGEHIAYSTSKKSITFGDDDLTINLKNRQGDEDITVDICSDINGNLVIGSDNSGARKYVAQVTIPAKEYDYEETENPSYNKDDKTSSKTITTRTEKPFDIDACTIALWAI